MPEWTARVSHAVFRLLMVGAALAGAYKQPLFKALEHPDPEIQALPRRVLPISHRKILRRTLSRRRR